jgi:hypothetical protein
VCLRVAGAEGDRSVFVCVCVTWVIGDVSRAWHRAYRLSGFPVGKFGPQTEAAAGK